MYNDGYHNIVNVDFSPVVIESMRTQCADCPGMTCKQRTADGPAYTKGKSWTFWI